MEILLFSQWLMQTLERGDNLLGVRRGDYQKTVSWRWKRSDVGEPERPPVSKILPIQLPDVHNILTIDLAEMQILWGKGMQKFELTKRYKMPDTQSFLENEGGGAWGVQPGEKERYFDWIYNFAKIDPNSEENQISWGWREGERWSGVEPGILTLGNDIISA